MNRCSLYSRLCLAVTGASMLCFTLLFCLTLAACASAVGGDNQEHKHAQPTLRMPSEYCCCSTETVDQKTGSVLEVLDRIVKRPYFRYFKVNINKPCDYWRVSSLCTSAGNPCSVCRCDAEEVPFGLKEEQDMGCPSTDPEAPAGGLNRKVAPGLGREGMWTEFEEAKSQETEGAEYVDLVTNPEAYTGYAGELAHRIWAAVYNENCFSAPENKEKNDGKEEGSSSAEKKEDDDQPVCSEQRVFYQLISGLHASISTHLSVRHPVVASGESTTATACGPNCQELQRRVLDHPERVDNLYVLYLFLLRAMTKAAPAYLDSGARYPADQYGTDDAPLRADLEELFHKELLCSHTFNETKVLESEQGRLLLPQMKSMMMNITTLMNCLTCEKCRVWGKLQTMGLATAFKVVTTPPGQHIELSRAEKMTLMNFLRQVSFSIHSLRRACPELNFQGTYRGDVQQDGSKEKDYKPVSGHGQHDEL